MITLNYGKLATASIGQLFVFNFSLRTVCLVLHTCLSLIDTWSIYRVLERLSGTRENISMLLRVLEVYMDSELYKKYLEDGSERLAGLYQHLVANGLNLFSTFAINLILTIPRFFFSRIS